MEVPSILLNRLLSQVAKKGASNLHLTVGSLPMLRFNNQLSSLEGEKMLTVEVLDKLIDSFTNEEEKKLLTEDKEIILVKVFAGNFRFRVNVFYQKGLPSISFNSIPEKIKSFSSLNWPEPLSALIKSSTGLLVVAGAYGSGKTTTAASVIEEINKNETKHIVTIESPIEQTFVSKKSIVEQRQVGSDTKSFAQALNYCLEEDIDIVYVGEIKNEFELAIPLIFDLSSGNSLVILELNANSAIRVIEKILSAAKLKISEQAARYNLADILLGIVVQKLLPKRGGGMTMANEILIGNAPVKSLIREGKIYQLESTMQTSRREGMINMDKALEELIAKGEIKRGDIK